jgi:hypothetical protein
MPCHAGRTLDYTGCGEPWCDALIARFYATGKTVKEAAKECRISNTCLRLLLCGVVRRVTVRVYDRIKAAWGIEVPVWDGDQVRAAKAPAAERPNELTRGGFWMRIGETRYTESSDHPALDELSLAVVRCDLADPWVPLMTHRERWWRAREGMPIRVAWISDEGKADGIEIGRVEMGKRGIRWRATTTP